jgi:hypothetical protein
VSKMTAGTAKRRQPNSSCNVSLSDLRRGALNACNSVSLKNKAKLARQEARFSNKGI